MLNGAIIELNWCVYIFLSLVALVNIIGFIMAGADKYRARKRLWRIPERTFFLTAILGGAVGVYAGLLFFRHKTRHWYFMYGIPLIFIAQFLLLFFISLRAF